MKNAAEKPKIVIDTNLLIADFFNKKSASYKIIDAAKNGKVKILWTNEILKEGKAILKNVKALPKFNKEIEKTFLPENKITNPQKVDIIKEDPSDNKFLSCALSGRTDMVISNDRHLLNVGKIKEIPIIKPVKAVKILNLT